MEDLWGGVGGNEYEPGFSSVVWPTVYDFVIPTSVRLPSLRIRRFCFCFFFVAAGFDNLPLFTLLIFSSQLSPGEPDSDTTGDRSNSFRRCGRSLPSLSIFPYIFEFTSFVLDTYLLRSTRYYFMYYLFFLIFRSVPFVFGDEDEALLSRKRKASAVWVAFKRGGRGGGATVVYMETAVDESRKETADRVTRYIPGDYY